MKLGLQCEVRYSPKIGRPRSVIIRNLRRLSLRGIEDKVVDLGRLYDLKARVVVHAGYFHDWEVRVWEAQCQSANFASTGFWAINRKSRHFLTPRAKL